MSLLLKVIPASFFWGVFAFVLLQVPYPSSITQATLFQLLAFFISIFLAIVFTFNIFLSFFLLSLTLASGIIFLLILKALDSLNLVTGILILAIVWLLFSYFKKNNSSSLTSNGKIHKLTTLRGRKR